MPVASCARDELCQWQVVAAANCATANCGAANCAAANCVRRIALLPF